MDQKASACRFKVTKLKCTYFNDVSLTWGPHTDQMQFVEPSNVDDELAGRFTCACPHVVQVRPVMARNQLHHIFLNCI